MYPGILVQMITTKQPSVDMIEVAIVSMEQALKADGEPRPAGSAPLERHPRVGPGSTAGAGEAATVPAAIDPPVSGA
jgi:hypothetical protein